ncbi:MAG TPA: right-handed parallel beta-helix repeat-containing protein [Gammaproteobacteria bacterium]|nr:right-handed parallel beta-helix repeat-containing protein [Gammaproteobacteria bacterium]
MRLKELYRIAFDVNARDFFMMTRLSYIKDIGFNQNCLIILAVAVLYPNSVLAGSQYYVDLNINTEKCSQYDVVKRKCGSGVSVAYKKFSGVVTAVKPGDTVYIREGTYNEQLSPETSGTKGNEITYRNFQNEKVIITGPYRPAIDLSNRQYLIIEGLEVNNVDRWLYLLKASHNIVRNNKFRNARNGGGGAKTGIFFSEATYNRVSGNTFENNSSDGMSLISSDYNIVENNTFHYARHALWDIRCGNFNVIRNNYFHNKRQKIGEVYDCHHHAGFKRHNATKYNLIEGNDFAFVPSSGNSSPYSGMQYAGQNGIIRFNKFHDLAGPGIRFAIYGKEARYNLSNRTYHNVFYGMHFAGIDIADGQDMKDNIFQNNIFTKSEFVANDTRWRWWVNQLDGQPVQIKTARLNGFLLDNNAIFGNEPGDYWLITNGWRKPGVGGRLTIADWESDYPELVKNTVEKNPSFVNEQERDFHLKPDSPLIDKGAFLTQTTGSGSGTVIPVKDVGYFYDGFSIPGEKGDIIQLKGQKETAMILSIDYKGKTLTLDKRLTWDENQGLTLKYNGQAPDIGMYEMTAD